MSKQTCKYFLHTCFQEADGKYYYNINVDGKSKYKREQTMPTVFDNVKYYESDPWYQPADASVKNIKFENYGK